MLYDIYGMFCVYCISAFLSCIALWHFYRAFINNICPIIATSLCHDEGCMVKVGKGGGV